MNTEQKSIADAIIEHHRRRHGFFHWPDDLVMVNQKISSAPEIVDDIETELEKRGLITFLDEEHTLTKLTEKGWNWAGFEKADRDTEVKLNEEKERQQLSDEKLKYDVLNVKRVYKTYWLTVGISVAGFLLALGKIIYDIWTKK